MLADIREDDDYFRLKTRAERLRNQIEDEGESHLSADEHEMSHSDHHSGNHHSGNHHSGRNPRNHYDSEDYDAHIELEQVDDTKSDFRAFNVKQAVDGLMFRLARDYKMPRSNITRGPTKRQRILRNKLRQE